MLRTFLRQDPDILMIGEIRDAETASIAIQAAQTGHLVLSTLHANNAIEIITRLQAMGISTDNLIQSSPLLMAQRLIRKLCLYCKQPETDAFSIHIILHHHLVIAPLVANIVTLVIKVKQVYLSLSLCLKPLFNNYC